MVVSNIILHNNNGSFPILLTTDIFPQVTEKDFFLLYDPGRCSKPEAPAFIYPFKESKSFA